MAVDKVKIIEGTTSKKLESEINNSLMAMSTDGYDMVGNIVPLGEHMYMLSFAKHTKTVGITPKALNDVSSPNTVPNSNQVTAKQIKYIKSLASKANADLSKYDFNTMTKRDAGILINKLKALGTSVKQNEKSEYEPSFSLDNLNDMFK